MFEFFEKVKKTIPFALKTLYGITFTTGEGMADAFVLKQIGNFLLGKSEDDTLDGMGIAGLCVATPIAIPMTLATLYSLSNKFEHHHHDHQEYQEILSDNENQFSQKSQNKLRYEDGKHHHHSLIQEIIEFLIIGGTFGILTFSASNDFLSKIISIPAVNYVLSGYFAMVIATGNWALHSEHLHDKRGIKTLLNRITTRPQKALAIISAASVFFGHFFQGFLAGNSFFQNIGITNVLLICLLSIGIGVLVTGTEGHTEVRSTLWQASRVYANESISSSTKVLLGTTSAIHALQPVFGAIQFINLVYSQSTGKNFAEEAALWLRLLLFTISLGIFFFPNAKGMYSATITASDKALKKVTTTCKSSFFKCASDEDNIVSPTNDGYHFQPNAT